VRCCFEMLGKQPSTGALQARSIQTSLIRSLLAHSLFGITEQLLWRNEIPSRPIPRGRDPAIRMHACEPEFSTFTRGARSRRSISSPSGVLLRQHFIAGG
jgi:hypothetical protein